MELRGRVWNWLPSFLEIAEHGSLVAASEYLHVTPAAVSRTLGLLEDELGYLLFNRVGRNLVLNQRGRSLRDAVRAASAQIDGGLSALQSDPFAGVLRVTSLGLLTESLVVDALIDLKRDYPQVIPEHDNVRASDALTRLARGELDMAFYYESLSVEDIVVEKLGETSMSVYCGEHHPLFACERVSQKRLLEYEFSVPQIGDTGRIMDGWPPELARKVGMRVSLLRSNEQVARSGTMLTVLPDITALPGVRADRLRRFRKPALPAIELFVARPAAGLERAPALALLDRVSQRLKDFNREIRSICR